MSPDKTNKMLCDVHDSCLVLVDIQEKLFAAIPQKVTRRLEANAQRILTAAGNLGIPVVATLQYPKGLGQLVPGVEKHLPQDTRIFEKTAFSCMAEPAFRDHMSSLNRKQVFMIGMETHICILQTALEMKEAGYQPWIPADATGARIRDDYDFGLARLQHSGMIITSTESILFEWLRDSRHPLFKDISALITNR